MYTVWFKGKDGNDAFLVDGLTRKQASELVNNLTVEGFNAWYEEE